MDALPEAAAAVLNNPVAFLIDRAISPQIVDLIAPVWTDDGIELHLPTLTGRVHTQLLVHEHRREELGKYRSEPGVVAIWCPVPRPGASTVLIVEGTKGHLAAASYAPEDVEVWGIAGCRNWSHDGVGLPELGKINGRHAIISLDGDITTNLDVNTAGEDLADALRTRGAVDVRFLRGGLNRAKAGMDDVLHVYPEAERPAVLAQMLTNAKKKSCDDRRQLRSPTQATDAVEPIEGVEDITATDQALGWAYVARYAPMVRLITDSTWYTFDYQMGRWDARFGNRAARSLVGVLRGQVRAVRIKIVQGQEIPTVDADWLGATERVDRTIKEAALYPHIWAKPEDFDHPGRSAHFFGVGNGVLQLDPTKATPDVVWRIGAPEDYLTRGTPVPYDASATCPEFERFLSEALPDADVRAYVQRLFGSAMLGRVDEHILPVFVGEGRNGKSTLLDVVRAVFGPGPEGGYAGEIKASTLMRGRFEEHLTALMPFHRARLVTCTETRKTNEVAWDRTEWDIERINQITGGDPISARRMREDEFSFAPSHLLVLATNHRPSVDQGMTAFWARYREVPFTVSFEGREDVTLGSRIMANELPGVLNWIIAGWSDYVRRGLDEPWSVTGATLETRTESEPLLQFANERMTRTGNQDDVIIKPEFRRHWEQWCQSQTPPLVPGPKTGRNAFNKRVSTELKLGDGFTGQGKEVRECWVGVRWRTDGDRDGLVGPSPTSPPVEIVTAPTAGKRGLDCGTPQAFDSGKTAGQTRVTADTADTVEISGCSHICEIQSVVDRNEIELNPLGGESRGEFRSIPSPAVDDLPPWGLTCENTPTVEYHEPAVSPDDPLCEAEQALTTSEPFLPLPEIASTVVVDLETASADERYDRDPTTFSRLGGLWVDGTYVDTTDTPALARLVGHAELAIGHNLVGYDLPVLTAAQPGAVDLLAMTRGRRVLDTMITEAVLDPPEVDERPNATERAMKHYKLDAVCERHGLTGKTDALGDIAKEYGGYDQIPVDDPRYRAYLRGDVDATLALAHAQLPQMTDYVWREHQVHAIAATMSEAGLQVDQPLLQRRYWRTWGRKQALARTLVARYGIPTVNAQGKPAESPQATKGGKAAIVAAFHSLGVDDQDLPRTGKGAYSFGSDNMHGLAQRYGGEVAELADVVADMAGSRTVYSTALEHLHADGRVHPQVTTYQASGRWSVTKPGLTVFGKRGQRVEERGIFTAAEGHVLLAADLSQIDARAIAAHSQDPAYMALFQPGIDSHDEVAARVWGDWERNLHPHHPRRQDAKAIGHGWNYGMGLTKLSTTAGVSREAAEQFDTAMKSMFPRLVSWRDYIREVGKSGWLDNGFGRIMRCNPDRAYTQAPALMGQGTARDLMMECLLRMPDEIVRMLRVQVHDEVILEVPVKVLREVMAIVKEAMTFAWAPPVNNAQPIQVVADISGYGRSWADCYRKG